MAGACGGDDGDDSDGAAPASNADATVKLEPTTFDPAGVKIKVGETVRWQWGTGVQHDVKSDSGGFDSGVKAKGSFDHTFDTPGTFEVVCTVHISTMKGTVEVS